MSIFKRQDATKLQQQVAALKGSSGFQKDEKEWKLTTDANKNGSATIRFLPARSDDELAFVRLVNHSFKKNNKWYINNCSATHGDYDGCPVCQYITEHDLFNKAQANKNGPEDEMLRLIGRKQSYWANILIIKDPANPDNNGKVFKFRFGKKIMDKITSALAGDEELEIPGINVTCPFGGANFTLKSKKQGDFPNYDDSVFTAASPIKGIDDEATQVKLLEGMSDLRPITAPDQFKTHAELVPLFSAVMGTSAAAVAATAAASLDDEIDNFDSEMSNFKNQSAGVAESGGKGTATSLSLDDDGEDESSTGTLDLGGDSATGDEELDKLLDF